MKHHPILFSTPMVQEIIPDKKTMTRRIMKPQPIEQDTGWFFPLGTKGSGNYYGKTPEFDKDFISDFCKYEIGDILWVRETWLKTRDGKIFYRADKNAQNLISPIWKPSIFMPRNAPVYGFE